MKSFFAALVLALTFSVTSHASDQAPVVYQAVENGPNYQVLAEKDGGFYQVLVENGGQPFFKDEAGNKFDVADGEGHDYPVVYIDSQTGAPKALPKGGSEEARDRLVALNPEAKDHLVYWRGGYGYYGYGRYTYGNYYYYPRYNYGSCGGGYYGGGYYGGYYSGYNNWGYNSYYYNSSYYGWYTPSYYTNPYCYSGNAYVINNWCY